VECNSLDPVCRTLHVVPNEHSFRADAKKFSFRKTKSFHVQEIIGVASFLCSGIACRCRARGNFLCSRTKLAAKNGRVREMTPLQIEHFLRTVPTFCVFLLTGFSRTTILRFQIRGNVEAPGGPGRGCLFESVGHETSRVLSKPIEHELQLRARMQSVEALQGRLRGNSNTGRRQGVAFCIRFRLFRPPAAVEIFCFGTPRAIESSCRRWDCEQRLLENGEEYNKGDLHLSGEPWSAENTWLQ
jgi:hypothetical protein